MRVKLGYGLVAGLIALSAPAEAAFTLDFEGMGSLHGIREFYNGGLSQPRPGASDPGRSGVDYGVSVGAGGLAHIDIDYCEADEGVCVGIFANNPSGKSVMATSLNRTTLDVAAGFTGEISFYHVTGAGFTVSIFEGLGGIDGLSQLLATQTVLQTPYSTTCSGNPTGAPFCDWTKLTLGFSGTARSVDFGLMWVDDLTFGAPATTPVPEPHSWALLIAGFGLVGAAVRRRRKLADRLFAPSLTRPADSRQPHALGTVPGSPS